MKKSESQSVNSQTFDVIIIGGGAAGMSAALWCDELGLSALLLEQSDELGGQLLWTFNPIKNHLGVEAENGRELQKVFLKQIKNRKFSLKTGANVSFFDVKNKEITLTNGEIFSAPAVIIATGVRRRKLDIEGEDFFIGRGILDSGKKDSEKAAGKTVLVVGGGDAAAENALILSKTARKVYLVHRRQDFRARKEFLIKIRNNPKISFISYTVLTKIIGVEKIEAVEIKNIQADQKSIIPTDFVLIRIGFEPNTEFLSAESMLTEDGYIEIDAECRTGSNGIYAVGDVASPVSPTVSTAVGMAATAVKSINILLSK